MRAFWTDDQLETLRINYANWPTYIVAHVCGHSERSTYCKARELGLAKSAEYLASPDSGRLHRNDNRGGATRFQKGHAPANKGLRRPGWAPGRMAQTQFKKGSLSGRARALLQPVGATRIVYGNLERKVSEGGPYPAARWQPVHRIVWEAAHGPVPAGHIVVFKIGRHTAREADITLDRLELVTRSENMRRNSRHTRYPPEVNEVIQLAGALKRKLNRRENRGNAQ